MTLRAIASAKKLREESHELTEYQPKQRNMKRKKGNRFSLLFLLSDLLEKNICEDNKKDEKKIDGRVVWSPGDNVAGLECDF